MEKLTEQTDIPNTDILNMEEIVMDVIVNAGSARSAAMKAMSRARAEDWPGAEALLVEAEDSLLAAHRAQTGLIQREASGVRVEMSLLLVHAEDHLANATVLRDMAAEIVALRKEIAEKR